MRDVATENARRICIQIHAHDAEYSILETLNRELCNPLGRWSDYHGFRYRFTGLKGCRESATLMGQWVAFGPPGNLCRLFTGVPEAAGEGLYTTEGSLMDESIHLDLTETPAGIAEILDHVKRGRERLVGFMDRYATVEQET